MAEVYHLLPFNLAGFGAPRLEVETSLERLADVVAEAALAAGGQTIIAHSVASITASLAASRPGCPVTTILALEGNLTPADAYYSGTAANYPEPEAFQMAFLKRLDRLAESSPTLARYRDKVIKADPQALWELGRDAWRFSENNSPGKVLMRASRAVYFYDVPNCPEETLEWLAASGMERRLLPGASHWPSVDVPDQLAKAILDVMEC